MSKKEKLKTLARQYSKDHNLSYTKALSLIRDKRIGLATIEKIIARTVGDPETLNRFRLNLLSLLGVTLSELEPNLVSSLAEIPVSETALVCVEPLSAAILADGYAMVEDMDLRICEIYMSTEDFAPLKKFCKGQVSDKNPHWALWGASIIVKKDHPQGRVFICGEGFFQNGEIHPSKMVEITIQPQTEFKPSFP